MKTIFLRPAEPIRDFRQLATWFSSLEDEPTTETGLIKDFEKDKERIIQKVAEDEAGELLGFYWASRSKVIESQFYFYLFVKPEQRGQGIGRQLYQDLIRLSSGVQAKALRVNVSDSCPPCRTFAERRGFTEQRHQIPMALNLGAFDDKPYEEIINRLKSEGFRFTSMEEMGNTDEVQRKLYVLNDTASSETPGAEGERTWNSFEDFQQSVCHSNWYKPGGQKVVIDTMNGIWAAMSAITRFEGTNYAYNLFTGVDRLYRGRKLAQAVKVLALRYARDVFQVNAVRTHHNTKNLPMIAIDLKLGYTMLPGTFLMEKIIG